MRSAFIILACLLFWTAPAVAALVPAELPKEYLLDEAPHAVAFYPGAAYRSNVDPKYAVKSIDVLEVRLALLPPHTVIHWKPAHRTKTGTPLLFGSAAPARELKRFCTQHHLDLDMLPHPDETPADPAKPAAH